MELEGKWPVLARHARAAEWLRIWAYLGRAPGTIDAYARGLVEFQRLTGCRPGPRAASGALP